MQRLIPVCLAAAIGMAPLGARAAGLVIWWDKPFYAQEEAALMEISAAFGSRPGDCGRCP
jgi:hypothetical protein